MFVHVNYLQLYTFNAALIRTHIIEEMICKQNWPKDVKRIHHARQTLHVLHNFEIDENYIQIEYSYTWMLTFILKLEIIIRIITSTSIVYPKSMNVRNII